MPRGDTPPYWAASDLGSLAWAVRIAQEKFLTGDSVGAGVRSLVLDSWRRSVDDGVDPGREAAPVVWNDRELAEARKRSKLAGALPMIRSLLVDPAAGEGHLVAIGDAQGRLLWVEGDVALRIGAESIGFVPGSNWSESAAGTNAPGTALALQTPVQIFASEHFRGTVQPWSCTAVPLRDPRSGAVLGVIDVTGKDHIATPQALAMVRATASAVEMWMAAGGYTPTVTQTETKLKVLGRERAVLQRDGVEITLSARHSELLFLLASHPKGLSTDRLAVMMHESDVPLVTVRAEMARLRKILGEGFLLSRPYRITEPVRTDVEDVIDALDRGDCAAATRMYVGPVLPSSQSPEIAEVRGDLRARVRRSALTSRDAEALVKFSIGEDGHDDVEVITAALGALPPTSPKRVGLTARLERLQRALSVPLPRLPGQRG